MENHTKSLKISILTSPSAWGGTEVHTFELARTLQTKGHKVTIFEAGSNFYEQKNLNQEGNISVISLKISSPCRKPGFFTSLRILLKLTGDICIIPKSWFHDGSLYLDLLARMIFFKYFTIEHLAAEPQAQKSSRMHLGGLIPGVGMWWYKGHIADFIRSILPNHIICVSDAVANMLIDNHHFSKNKVTTIRNGIDSSKYQPNNDYRTAFRNRHGIPSNSMVFGSIGRLNTMKGLTVGLELFRKLISLPIGRDVWFVVVGDGPEYEQLKHLAEAPDIKEHVRLLSFSDKPWEIYPAFDVFLMPSRNEGLPLSLLESMACGCCPIAMGVGGIPEVITDPSMGWIVKPDDQQGFYEAMKEVAGFHCDRIRKMGLNARKHIVLNFEAQKQFLSLAHILEKECRY